MPPKKPRIIQDKRQEILVGFICNRCLTYWQDSVEDIVPRCAPQLGYLPEEIPGLKSALLQRVRNIVRREMTTIAFAIWTMRGDLEANLRRVLPRMARDAGFGFETDEEQALFKQEIRLLIETMLTEHKKLALAVHILTLGTNIEEGIAKQLWKLSREAGFPYQNDREYRRFALEIQKLAHSLHKARTRKRYHRPNKDRLLSFPF